MKKSFEVLNIKCGGCTNSIQNALKNEFNNVEIDLSVEPRIVTVDIKDSEHEKLFREKMKKAGYPMADENLGKFESTGLKAKSFVSCAIGKMS